MYAEDVNHGQGKPMSINAYIQANEAMQNVIYLYFQGLYRLENVESQLKIIQKNKEYCRDYAAIDLMDQLDNLMRQDETGTQDECTNIAAEREIGYHGGMKEHSGFNRKGVMILKRLEKIIPSFNCIVANKLLGIEVGDFLKDYERKTPSPLINAVINKVICHKWPGDDYSPLYMFAMAFICAKSDCFIEHSEIDQNNKVVMERNLPKTYDRVMQLSRTSRRNFIEADLSL
jgi:hypothetical protein